MKTKVEIEGYEIEITFAEGMISVTAQKDEEVVEEFSINVEEGQEEAQGEGGEEIQNFGDFDEEEDFSGDDLEDELEGQDDEDENEEDDDDDDDDDEMPEGGAALESFQSYINKKRK